MSKAQSVPNPCMNICELGADDICVACMRSGREISEWGAMSDDQKRDVWKNIRAREAALNPPLQVAPSQ